MSELKQNEDHDEMVSLPKVLLINVQSLSLENATGHTLRNLFESWPNDILMQICLDINVNNRRKEHIKTINIELTWIPFEKAFRKIYKIFTGNEQSQIQVKTGINAAIRDVSISGKLHDAIRGLLDISPVFLPSDVLSKIISFNPDVVYTMGASIRALRLSNKLAERFKIPISLHLMDNWPETKYTSSILLKPIRRLMFHELNKLHSRSGAGIAISPKMAEYYEKRQGVKYYNAMNCVDYISQKLFRNEDGCVRFLYAGGLHLNRWKSLAVVAGCLAEMRNEGHSAELVVHIPDVDKHNFGELLIKHGVIIKPFVPANEIEKLLAGADVLLLLESFDRNVIQFTLYSMSTKVPEYMSAGRPILSYAPKMLASSEYIIKTQSGIVVETENELKQAIKTVIMDKAERIKMAKNGVETAKKYHTKKMVAETMIKVLTTKK